MLSFVIALAGFAGIALAGPPASEIRFVQFDPSYLTNQYASTAAPFNGFYHEWRGKCVQYCGAADHHHLISLNPLRKADTASVICYCCPRDDTTGTCYTKAKPFSPTSVTGPYLYLTDTLITKMGLQNITSASITSVALPTVNIKGSSSTIKAGTSVRLTWTAPKSEFGGAFYAHFQSGSTSTAVKLDAKNTCIFPANLKGSIKVWVSSGSSSSAVYAVTSSKVVKCK